MAARSIDGVIGGGGPIHLVHPDRMQEDQQHRQVLSEAAKSRLGRGYNADVRVPNDDARLKDEVIDQATGEVEIREARALEAYHSACTTNQVVEALRREFKINFNFSNQTVSFAPSIQHASETNSREDKTRVVYVTTYVDYYRYGYKNLGTLQLKPGCDVADQRNVGDSFVSSVWVYTGYRVFVEMSVDSNVASDRTELSIGGSLGAWSCNLGTGFSRLRDSLRGKVVTEIRLTRETFGRYPMEHIRVFDLHSLEGIDKRMTFLRREYLECAKQIAHPSLLIDDTCLRSYADLVQRIPPRIEADGPTETILLGPIEREPDFRALAFRLENALEAGGRTRFRKKLLGPLSHIQLLTAFNEVFSTVFSRDENFLLTPSSNSTMVVGSSGVGKSSLINYLRGLNYEKNEWYDDEDNYIRELIPTHEIEKQLETGGLSSVTKGFSNAPGYIDTAGFLDSQGPEVDICNSNAIRMATKLFQPKRLIIVVDPSYFEIDRCRLLFKLIKRISRVISNPTGEKELRSIYFIVNDKKSNTSHRMLQGYISRARRITMDILEKKCSSLQKPGLFSGICSLFTIRSREITKNELEKFENMVDPETNDFLRERFNEVEILDRMLAENNFCVVDMTSSASRDKIHGWERSHGEFVSDSFKMGDLVTRGEEIFDGVIKHLAHYFNSRFNRKIEIETSLFPKIHERVAAIPLEKRSLDLGGGNRDKINEYRERIDDLRRLKADSEGSLQKAIRKRRAFKHGLGAFKVNPDRDVTPRSRWALFDWMAKEYPITYVDAKQEPIEDVTWIREATSHRKYPLSGKYLKESKSYMLGKYSVNFLPKWHGYDGDCDAAIYVFQQRRYLARFISEIQEKKNVENALKDRFDTHEQEIQRYARLKDALETDDRVKIRQAGEELDKELEAKNNDLPKLNLEVKSISDELVVYQPLCSLIKKTIQYLGLDEIGEESGLKIFRDFCNNFRDVGLASEESHLIIPISSSTSSSSGVQFEPSTSSTTLSPPSDDDEHEPMIASSSSAHR